jgi:uncharacterized protein YyaL (SSP411 family)
MSKTFRYFILMFAAMVATAVQASEPLRWTGWSGDLFARAKAQHRFVILDLEAVWCHWCHVMDQNTYSNPKVQALLRARYIPVRVDQDSDPALAARYGDWGWPATIVFGPEGEEIVKLRGYVEPDRMVAMLRAIIDDPTPGPSVDAAPLVAPSASSTLPRSERAALAKTYDESYDAEHAGWGDLLKYIDADSMDYALALAETGDKPADARARRTFDVALALIDPVWGGVYQYSVDPDWSSPHFEKIISFQTQYIRQYAQAYLRGHDERYRSAALAIETYLTTFLMSPDGAFYVSQDADLDKDIDGHKYYALGDAGRRALGMPRIDKHLYARENGWAITALVAYANATDDAKALSIAEGAAAWMKANRPLPGGGFRHSDADRGGPFLGDTLAMGQAFIDLYAATADRRWLEEARQAGDFIGATFKDDAGGFVTAKSEAKVGVFAKPEKQIDDQVQVARFMNILYRYDGNEVHGDLAKHAMRYLAGAAIGLERPLPGVLLADLEISTEPTHITIVGHKDDKAAQELFSAARSFPALYKRLEWWDTREGPLANADVDYPELDRPAAFACSNHICSLPAFTADDLSAAVALMARPKTTKDATR